ncbi:hypothetical protein ACIQV3_34870 [Streptomyces sp. NPDC099050]|uniref:hypothetical protein n=1 Tax=Streptomyces sp. NPDC099050 TaxID=3366100 RepID=UPI00382B2799
MTAIHGDLVPPSIHTDAAGRPVAALATYQAAYALTAYALFGLDEGDGHFRWCAQQLRHSAVFRGTRSA